MKLKDWPNNRIFVTHIISEKYIAKYRLATAGCNFSFNLLSGNCFSKVFSILPTNVGCTIDAECFNDNRYELVYETSLRLRGKLGIAIASFIEQSRIFLRIPKNASLWLYNVTDLNIYLIFLLRLFKRSVQINVIVLDFTPNKRNISLANFYLHLINKMHGLITLSDSNLFTVNNKILLPGVVPSNAGNEPIITQINNRFLLSGVLSEHIAMTSMVVEAFSQLPQCELHITGFLQDDEVIKQYAGHYPNIVYHGRVKFEDYLDILHSCTYQLSTRDVTFPENQCNFPSKIIEALLHNRAIVSTIPYRQISDINYFVVGSQIDVFRDSIADIVSLPNLELMGYVNQGKKVESLFNTSVWDRAMSQIEGR